MTIQFFLYLFEIMKAQNNRISYIIDDQHSRNFGTQECADKISQCYLECKNNEIAAIQDNNDKGIRGNCYLDCNKQKESINKPEIRPIQTVYETRTITEDQSVSTKTFDSFNTQNRANVQLPCVDVVSDVVKAVTSQFKIEKQPSETKEMEMISQSSSDNKQSISVSVSNATLTTTISANECKENDKAKSKNESKYEDKDEEYTRTSIPKNKSENIDSNIITVTRFIHDTTTLEKPMTLFREITTTITLDHPIINYKITTVTQNDTITTTKSKIETVTSFITKTSIKNIISTISNTLDPSISYKTETEIFTSHDTETIHDVSTSISTAFSTLISSLISTLLNQETSTIQNTNGPLQDEMKTTEKEHEKVSENLLQPTLKSASIENVFEREFLPLLKKLIQKQTVEKKDNDQEIVTITEDKKIKQNKEDACDENKPEIPTVTKIETETITKYKKSKPKTITKSSIKKKTITVTENANKTKGPKTVFNTIYKYDKRNDECTESKNDEKPSKTVTIYSKNNEECENE